MKKMNNKLQFIVPDVQMANSKDPYHLKINIYNPLENRNLSMLDIFIPDNPFCVKVDIEECALPIQVFMYSKKTID